MTADDLFRSPGAVLVVDDEAPIGEILQQWLEEDGYHARYVSNFEDVKTAMAQDAYDLVTLDIMMPDVSGMAILPWIREHYPDTAVIMATALIDLNTVLEAMRLGAINYLLKPFNMGLVSEEVARAMERQRLIAENRSYQKTLEHKVEVQTRQIRRAHQHLECRVRELEGRDRLVRFQMTAPNLDAAHHEILEAIGEVFDLGPSVLYRSSLESRVLRPVAARGTVPPQELEGTSPETRQLILQVATSRQIGEIEDGQIAVPLLYKNDVLGVVWLSRLDEPLRVEALEALSRLALQAAALVWSAGVIEDLDKGQLEINQLLGME